MTKAARQIPQVRPFPEMLRAIYQNPDATESSRSRTFRIQIHYKNEKTERSWQPGELMIECPDLRSLFLDDLPDEPMAMVPQIAADPVGAQSPLYKG